MVDNVLYDYPQTGIANGATTTYESFQCWQYNGVKLAIYTDRDCTGYIDFSTDNSNWDSSIPFTIEANVNEVHIYKPMRKWFRIRISNASGADSTFVRMQTILSGDAILTSGLNSNIQTDADALVVRPYDYNIMIANGLIQNQAVTIKDGVVADIDTGTVPEDLWSEGGVYTGFPTGATEEGQIVIAGADTGTVWYSYLESDTSTDYTFASKAVTGAGNYDLGHNIYRCNFAYFVGSAVNVGKITIRHKTTTANVFVTIDANIGQSYCGAYTVPYGSSVFIDRWNGNMRGSTSGSLDGYVYYRAYGESYRLRFPFELQYGSLYFDEVDYLVKIPQRVDFIPRIVAASTNNLGVKFSYRVLKIKS